VRDRVRSGLFAHSERRLSGLEAGEFTARSGWSLEDHRFRLRQEANRQVISPPSSYIERYYPNKIGGRKKKLLVLSGTNGIKSIHCNSINFKIIPKNV